MGVQGLWELLTPVGRRVSVDALGSRKLAIDASIWIIQFMKAMRDDKGDMIRNAHLLGFFRRICKLLYLRIKPVFVFDGATPALKRRTVIARRRQREQAQSKIRKTAEKLLLNHLRTRKLEEIASGINLNPQSKNKLGGDVEKTPVFGSPADENSRPKAQIDFSHPSSLHEKYDQAATDALLAASLAADYGENLSKRSPGGSAEGSDDEDEDEDDGEEQLILPGVQGLDPSVLASLPPSMQLDLLVQMREQLVAKNRQNYQKVAKVPSSFSAMQIQAYLKTVAFRREITEVQKAAAGGGIGGVPTARVASTSDREFIFSKTFEGEKPAPNKIEEQRRVEQATPPKVSNSKLPASLIKQSSALFASITGTHGEGAPEEDGVISLVSTDLNKDSDFNSNSMVHTYVDERGHVRVNRRRGMGVRMTRDLQWNLYLMKDLQDRQSEDKGTSVTSGPPVIPSANARDATLETPSASQSSSLVGNGFQISFVDDEVSALTKDEDGDLFQELVTGGGDGEDDTSVIHGRMFSPSNVSSINLSAGVINGEEEEEEVDWEDGGFNERSRDGSVVEDKDLAEAVRLSLVGQPPVARHPEEEPNNQVLLEDGRSTDESEVEWEEGTGDVSVVDLDGAITENLNGGMLMRSEEAEVDEAIRRSLEHFHPSRKPSTQLVIKEPADSNRKGEIQGLEPSSKTSPLVRAEAESDAVYLARERTRKGKAVFDGGNEDSLLTTDVRRPYSIILEQDQIAALTLSGMPVSEATMQPPPPAMPVNNPSNVQGRESKGKLDSSSTSIPESTGDLRSAKSDAPSYVQSRDDSEVEVETTSMKFDKNNNPYTSRVEILEVKPASVHADGHYTRTDRQDLRGILQLEKQLEATEPEAVSLDNLGRQGHAGLPLVTDGPEVSKGLQHPRRPGPQIDVNQDDPSREAEEINAAIERDELQSREAALREEREKLAREEANLQELLEMEQADLQAGLDRERELLADQELELLAEQKKNERNADSVTGEMFAEVQELLQMFGIPYIIAPMEAEAQCAYMDTIQLVDGVVTDDSDVFLFGGRTVYKNLFDDRKYVETYYMKDLESEMGMSREKLIRIAMLLGSDYTEGVSGIGIVNAIEVVNAFPEQDGLQKFKEWLDSPDHALFQKAQRQSKGKGKSNGKGDKIVDGLDGNGAGDTVETDGENFTLMQKSFMHKHRGVSKNWVVPESFPSESVVNAYISPVVEKSAEAFTWGRPDLEALRGFCYERFIWNKQKADELLLPVLKEHDRRETQTRLESFYHFNQRFAKIRSRRIQKAVTGMTGKRSAELMDLPPHLITDASRKKSRKQEPQKPTDVALENNLGENLHDDVGDALDTRRKGAGRGGKGRARRPPGGKQQSGDLESNGPVAANVDNGVDVTDLIARGGRNRSRGRAQGSARSRCRGNRGRGRGRGRGKPASEEESISDSSESDDAVEDVMAGENVLKRKAETVQPRRSTRQRSQVPTYQVDDSDEEAGGTCSDGEEMFKEVDLLVAQALQNKPKLSPGGINSTEADIPVGSSEMAITEGARLEKISVSSDLPLETREFVAGGGFCLEEDDELGQTGQEMGERDYGLGGGFCLSDDEQNLPVDRGINVFENNPLSQASPGVGVLRFCSSDEDGKEVSPKPTDSAQEHTKKHSDNSTPQKFDTGSIEVDQHTVVRDCSVSANGIQGLGPSHGPAELGLRAMPLMRRKKQKKSADLS